MSKFDEAVVKYTADLEAIGAKVDADLLHKVAKGLGPSIYNKDSQLVACSDKAELARVRKNFLVGKLGLADNDSLDGTLSEVCKQYDKRQKHRAVFYYLLVQKLGKQGAY